MLVSIENLGVVDPSIIAEEEKRDVMECAKERWRRGGWRARVEGRMMLCSLKEGYPILAALARIVAVFRSNDKADERGTGGWDSARLGGFFWLWCWR